MELAMERLPQQVEQKEHLPGLFLAALRSAGRLSRAAQQHLRSDCAGTVLAGVWALGQASGEVWKHLGGPLAGGRSTLVFRTLQNMEWSTRVVPSAAAPLEQHKTHQQELLWQRCWSW
jgi:hypothetical protein